MTSSFVPAELEMMVTFELPMDDIVASLPYVLPMITLGVLLLLYQRHMAPTSTRRNLMILIGGLSFAAAIIAVVYASLGGMFGFGSWTTFVNGLQLLTNLFFGSISSSLVATSMRRLMVKRYVRMPAPTPRGTATIIERRG